MTQVFTSLAGQLVGLLTLLFALFPSLVSAANDAQPDSLESRLTDFSSYPHLEIVEHAQESVEDHLVGLGAMKKVRGVWGLKDSERLSGELTRYTWRVIDGFTAEEVMAELQSALLGAGEDNRNDNREDHLKDQGEEVAQPLFACDGRACGHGAQWASRVFGQRILYGRGDAQRYRIYSLSEGAYRLVIYASTRSSDRHYLHVELLQVISEEQPEAA